MWFIEVHAVNQLLRHIPYAEVNLSFSSWEADYSSTLPYYGFDTLGPMLEADGFHLKAGQQTIQSILDVIMTVYTTILLR